MSSPVFRWTWGFGGWDRFLVVRPGTKPPQETGFSGNFCGGKRVWVYQPTGPCFFHQYPQPIFASLDMGHGTHGHHHYWHGAAARAPMVTDTLGRVLVFFFGHVWSHILDMFTLQKKVNIHVFLESKGIRRMPLTKKKNVLFS